LESTFVNNFKNIDVTEKDQKKELFLEKNDDIVTLSNKETNPFNINFPLFKINEYDESCEEFSKIEKVIILKYSKSKLILFAFLNIFTAFLINLILVWYPHLKLYLIFSNANVNEGQFVGIYGSGKINIFSIKIFFK